MGALGRLGALVFCRLLVTHNMLCCTFSLVLEVRITVILLFDLRICSVNRVPGNFVFFGVVLVVRSVLWLKLTTSPTYCLGNRIRHRSSRLICVWLHVLIIDLYFFASKGYDSSKLVTAGKFISYVNRFLKQIKS